MAFPLTKETLGIQLPSSPGLISCTDFATPESVVICIALGGRRRDRRHTQINVLPTSPSTPMDNWAVFLTAPRARAFPKALNRAFLLIQDFEYSEYPADSRWILLKSTELPAGPLAATTPPLAEISGNDFAEMSFVEINAFVRAHPDALEDLGLSAGNWLIIDQKGLETSTCLVCEQYSDSGSEDGEMGMADEFRACRIPYEEAHSMITNLDIGNMGFEEFVDEEAGEQEDGSWKWMSFTPDVNDSESGKATEAEMKRKRALKELRDGGHTD
ncbi:hypothetical protein DFH09DRAFT_1187960 [Mycena vulgaris]|nr:hypothetical protein DFH09DRAFT_1187960 [Mycena vulgaris]